MSSIERRVSPTGEQTWRVRFRHAGSNKARAFVSEAKAEAWRSVLDAVGPERALAILTEMPSTSARTVADQVDHHIAHLTDLTEGTRRRYQKIADAQLRPRFGGILAGDLTRDHVAAWVNQLATLSPEQRPAPKTIRNWHGLLSSALASGVRDGLIPSNVARGVKPASRATAPAEMVFLTGDEVALLLTHIPEHYRALVLLLVLTGVRYGEATALSIRDLDPANNSARIHLAWKHTESGSMQLGPPKSARSLRTVAVPDAVFEALGPHVAGRRGAEIALLTPRGNPIRSGTFHNVVWQKAARALEDAVGKKPRVHDLRHTYASWAIQKNVPLPVIQRQMGHESITTTVDRYGHLARADFDPLLSLGANLTPPPAPAAIEA